MMLLLLPSALLHSGALQAGSPTTALPRPVTDSPLIAQAKRYFALGNKVKQQLGPTNPEDLKAELADEFAFVAPLVGPLGKDAIIGATTGLDIGAGLPDFDARYHDFRVDCDDPMRVWCTMRVQGTHTGTFSFAGVEAAPKSPPTVVNSPPEAVSLRFDDEGKVVELDVKVDRVVRLQGHLHPQALRTAAGRRRCTETRRRGARGGVDGTVCGEMADSAFVVGGRVRADSHVARVEGEPVLQLLHELRREDDEDVDGDDDGDGDKHHAGQRAAALLERSVQAAAALVGVRAGARPRWEQGSRWHRCRSVRSKLGRLREQKERKSA